MKTLRNIIYSTSRYIDFWAGLILAGTAALVVANILMRVLLNRPILGTYELVGYLTAAVIGLSVAHCAVQNSHIAVSFLFDRLPRVARRAGSVIVNVLSLFFLGLASWHLARHASVIAASGEVSPTIQLAFYPFIYLISFGFLVLALVTALDLLDSISGGEGS